MFSVLGSVFPFVREMLLGDKTIREAFKNSKSRVFMLFAIMASFGINLYIVPRSITISKDYIELNKKYKDLDTKYAELLKLSAANPSMSSNDSPPTAPDSPKPPVALPLSTSAYDRVKQQMNPNGKQ